MNVFINALQGPATEGLHTATWAAALGLPMHMDELALELKPWDKKMK